MRELKFRVWDMIDKEWWNDLDRECVALMLDGDLVRFPAGGIVHDIVVEQYIGLQDGQGRDIYEGDIVEDYMSDTTEVVSLDPNHNFIFNRFDYKGFSELVARGRIQVVGNIHENPELVTST
jgi:hypothetical protein